MEAKLTFGFPSWDFSKANTKELTHCYHSYPAMMIPQIAHRLIELYGSNDEQKKLLDPFCGSGTALLEGILKGYRVIGSDLNPLARLISKSKCTFIEPSLIEQNINRYVAYIYNKINYQNLFFPDFKNINFWFKEDVIIKLSVIRNFLTTIEVKEVEDFFNVAFSETIRESSLTKLGEFKLVRRKGSLLQNYNPDVFQIMLKKLERNFCGLKGLKLAEKRMNKIPNVQIFDFDTSVSIPAFIYEDGLVDLVVTSPPYGDSHTTVAYGQYSRLSNQWLGIEDASLIDKKLMGGRKIDKIKEFGLPQLDIAIKTIYSKNPNRAKEVCSFYIDYENSCKNIASVVKHLGFVCYVVSNRRVQGMVLPTAEATSFFFEKYGFRHFETHFRNIPNKRMPYRNSPSNIKGEVAETMTKEAIVVLQKVASE